jgi:DNA mismatch repair protein MutL
MGIQLELFGKNSVLIRSIPLLLKQESPEQLIRNIADELLEIGSSERVKSAERKLLISLSCRRAVKAGDKLDHISMKAIIDALFRDNLTASCPHGRPIIISIDRTDIERKFKR